MEIKSGKDYKQHAALDNALAVGDWNLEQALVFCFGNVEQKGKITYLPFYMIMFFQQISLDNLIIDFNVEI